MVEKESEKEVNEHPPKLKNIKQEKVSIESHIYVEAFLYTISNTAFIDSLRWHVDVEEETDRRGHVLMTMNASTQISFCLTMKYYLNWICNIRLRLYTLCFLKTLKLIAQFVVKACVPTKTKLQ